MSTQALPSPQELREFISNNFNHDELALLCHSLESLVLKVGPPIPINLGVIGSNQTSISTLALNLVQFMQRRGLFEILVQGVCNARSNAPFCPKQNVLEPVRIPRDVLMPLSLKKIDFDELVNLLADQFIPSSEAIRFLRSAMAGSPKERVLMRKINFDGSALNMAIEIVNQVCIFGEDIPGQETLLLIIKELKKVAGVDKHHFLNGLVTDYSLIKAVQPINYDNSSLERLIRPINKFFDVLLWRTKLEQIERQICRIDLPHSTGTGFLVAPDVVMTNYHVVEDVISGMYQANEVALRFDYKKSVDGGTAAGQIYKLVNDTPVIAQSGYREISADQLDFALLRVQGQPGNERGYITLPSCAYRFQDAPAIFIAQHPNGEAMKLTLDTDAFIELLPNATTPYRVRYRTNTEHGSSGSPCFNQDWELVALHHSGDPTKISVPEWNEGIPISAIVAFLQKRNLWPIQ